ncbi:putative protein kinase RLK-Pelle-RLCK-VIIa-2 family [Helianthus annuus]|nr:putative protein kinase RLK-Pelle-RLCK-VIIa-2 family [Helianthus annuus]
MDFGGWKTLTRKPWTLSGEQDPDLVAEAPSNEIQPSEQCFDDSSNLESPSSVEVISRDIEDLKQNLGYTNLDSFTYDEMRMATELFNSNLVIGEGGFGVVYKGIIDESVRSGYNRVEVAIKKLNPMGLQGEKEWLTELNYLARLRHPNLMKLIGYCCEGTHRLLVYEFMSAGSLEDIMFAPLKKGSIHPLSWGQRMKIALDAAKGLQYLHTTERPVIYRDFKSSNILLDENFNAKLSDFGIAKDAPMGKTTHISTRVVGTEGYTAPDYAQTGHLRVNSDTYALGVVLLELALGLRAIDDRRASDMRSLPDFANQYMTHKRVMVDLIDPRMERNYSRKDAVKVINLALQCLHDSPVMRPPMSKILKILESVQTPEASFQSESESVTTADPKKTRKSRYKLKLK